MTHRITLGAALALTGAALLLAVSANLAQSGTPAKPEPLPPLPTGIVARVGTADITAEQVLARIAEIERAKPNDPQHLDDAYTYLMNLAVVNGEAKRLGMSVTADEQAAEAKSQIGKAKEKLKAEYPGVTWEQYAASQGFKQVERFEALFHERAPQILLKRRLIWLFELTTRSVGIMQIKVTSRTTAVKVLAKLDAELKDLKRAGDPDPPKNGEKPANPPAAPRSRWPAGTVYAPAEISEAFHRIAHIQTTAVNSILDDAFEGQSIAEAARKMLFETLKVGEYSDIVEMGAEDFRIFFLKRSSPASSTTYAELKKDLDAMPDPEVLQFARWSRINLDSGRYPVRWRRPGEPEPVPAPAKAAEEKPTEAAKTPSTPPNKE